MPTFSTCACAVQDLNPLLKCTELHVLCQTNSVLQHPESKVLVPPDVQTIVVLAMPAQLSSLSRPGQMHLYMYRVQNAYPTAATTTSSLPNTECMLATQCNVFLGTHVQSC